MFFMKNLKTASLGFPRIGAKRELKFILEKYWKDIKDFSEVEEIGKKIREENWKIQSKLDFIPSGDFSYYDHILDLSFEFNNVARKFDAISDKTQKYFAVARGYQKNGYDLHANEMSKWFNTNYHYIVPEFHSDVELKYTPNKFVNHFLEAKVLGYKTRPVILGPISYLFLGKEKTAKRTNVFEKLLNCYIDLIIDLKNNGCTDIQLDEPCLVTDLDLNAKDLYKSAYKKLNEIGINIHLTTYFDELGENTELAFSLPVKSIHVDITEFDFTIPETDKTISLGVISGRNVWKCNLDKVIDKVKSASNKNNVIISTSCSLLHVPVTLANEKKLDEKIKNRMSFAVEKIDEVLKIKNIISEIDSHQVNQNNPVERDEKIWEKLISLEKSDYFRKSSFAIRKEKQKKLGIPLFPTTTLGSFPQTEEVRKARADFKKSTINQTQYDDFCRHEIAKCIKIQEDLEIDVLVHGEFERNDMVEYFGENLNGFCFTENGWVQSYGSRCVKPPVIYGDVSRSRPITVQWSKFAQSCTKKIMKGMLTGPITILKWSFVRTDIPLETTCKQIALAIQDEVKDLEKAGIKIIQIDEPAIREGLPLRKSKWDNYLKWAVECFRISCQTVEDETQIHTHMCYSEFNDIINHILAMDADCLSIECSRSDLEVLQALKSYGYTNDIGPGIWDIHSPRIPSVKEMTNIVEKMIGILKPEQIWINPDCGLKTRGWKESIESLKNLVEVAKHFRKKYA